MLVGFFSVSESRVNVTLLGCQIACETAGETGAPQPLQLHARLHAWLHACVAWWAAPGGSQPCHQPPASRGMLALPPAVCTSFLYNELSQRCELRANDCPLKDQVVRSPGKGGGAPSGQLGHCFLLCPAAVSWLG